jgi:glycosyltransferase involved in cell wall biosynthesis
VRALQKRPAFEPAGDGAAGLPHPMKILFTSGFQYLPQIFGGLMSNTHDFALELIQRGHDVRVAAKLKPDDYPGLRTRLLGKLVGKQRVYDTVMGYPVYRRWFLNETDLTDIVERVRPDVAVVQAAESIGTARHLQTLGVPVILYFHDVEFHLLDGDPRELKNVVFVSNSQFTANKYREKFGIHSTVIAPIFRADSYRSSHSPDNITMINPRPVKGSEIMSELIEACPDIPFCLVESWELSAEEKAMWRRKMKLHSNLTLRARTTDMASVYQHAKLVLMPSKWDEAWGRVASEAQFNGIPVIASNRGGLPEAVGPGGVLLDPDKPERWIDAVRRLWDDKIYYSKLSAAAAAYSVRPEIDPEFQIFSLLRLAEQAITLAQHLV